MIVCDYCGKDCSSDHADIKIEAYRWTFAGHDYAPKKRSTYTNGAMRKSSTQFDSRGYLAR